MNLQFKNTNAKFYSFVAVLVLCIAVLSIGTQYNAFGLSSDNQTQKKTGTLNVNTVKSNIKTASEAALALKDILKKKGIASGANINIVVSKSSHTLSLYSNGVFLKSYHVELGEGGPPNKSVVGDKKTPEGDFYITEKTVYSPADYYLGTRWMELSYPNLSAAQRGLNSGIISKETYNRIVKAINNGETPPQDTALGGYIGIHGGSVPSFGKDWTWGCVGLANKDVEDFYGFVRSGTKVTINM
ncbi:MAG: L,D-transpeptidase [Bacteroidota bacterium]|nr:L,D-transpeptidase [Bacteroidota bacterium]